MAEGGVPGVEDVARLGARGGRKDQLHEVSAGIDFAVEQLERAPFTSKRRAIDVSGDGTNNSGREAWAARDDAIAKGIARTSQVPREDVPGRLCIEKRRSIIPLLIRACWLWLSIEMDASIFVAHFPVILPGIPPVSDARKEALDSRSIEDRSVRVMRDWNQVICS